MIDYLLKNIDGRMVPVHPHTGRPIPGMPSMPDTFGPRETWDPDRVERAKNAQEGYSRAWFSTAPPPMSWAEADMRAEAAMQVDTFDAGNVTSVQLGGHL